MNTYKELNLHQKLLKIADAAGVLQKDKQGYNYRYVPEEAIQAKVTAGMQKYGVMLYPSLAPNTLQVTPYHYEKPKGTATIPVNEVIVQAEVVYTWVNTDNPEDKYECRWAYIGQMEDASQAFGAGATYGNRYFLIKALQLATTEADPDAYRSAQRKAENYEEEKLKAEMDAALQAKRKEVTDAGSKLIASGIDKAKIREVVAKVNGGNGNVSAIPSIEVCEEILKAFEELAPKK